VTRAVPARSARRNSYLRSLTNGLELHARSGIGNEAHGRDRDASSHQGFGDDDGITLARFLAVTHEDDHALRGILRKILRRVFQRKGDRRVTLRLGRINAGGNGVARTFGGAKGDDQTGILAIFCAAGDCAP
jgi:hypothetical protein